MKKKIIFQTLIINETIYPIIIFTKLFDTLENLDVRYKGIQTIPIKLNIYTCIWLYVEGRVVNVDFHDFFVDVKVSFFENKTA